MTTSFYEVNLAAWWFEILYYSFRWKNVIYYYFTKLLHHI